MSWEVRQGDALDRLREMPAGSVQTCVTSPPYFGLRDYGTGEWSGGDDGCDHRDPASSPQRDASGGLGGGRDHGTRGEQGSSAATIRQARDVCGKCGATRTDSQVGLESTPDAYVARLVEVFREVRRVLRDDGTLWLNLGDSYNAYNGGAGPGSTLSKTQTEQRPKLQTGYGLQVKSCKPKDLLGIPWMVAFALRADGWYLRSDIVWSKPNPMPESVTDRPTKSHEYVFLLSKGPRYFYDADAIREEHQHPHVSRTPNKVVAEGSLGENNGQYWATENGNHPGGRNKRSVWTVATQPFPGAHFAVFPPKLIEPCVLAGSAPKACGVCGGPWERVVERETVRAQLAARGEDVLESKRDRAGGMDGLSVSHTPGVSVTGTKTKTLGWEPSCSHTEDTGTSTVLDPFSGAGTTGLVALQHGRSFIGIELNPAYVQMASERIATAERLGFRPPERGPVPMDGQVSIFDLDGEAA